MKFQNPSIHHSKVNTHTDRQAESNMPFQLFQSWGHKEANKSLLLNNSSHLKFERRKRLKNVYKLDSYPVYSLPSFHIAQTNASDELCINEMTFSFNGSMFFMSHRSAE